MLVAAPAAAGPAAAGARRFRGDPIGERMTARTVGRDAEVALLHRALSEAAAPSGAAPRVVALSGEPGIGKSHLLAALAAAAANWAPPYSPAAPRSGGTRCPTRSGSTRSATRPVRPPPPAWTPATTRPSPAILPSAGAPGAGAALGAGERHRAHRAVRALLEALARDRAAVLVLDDLQHADAASTDLLVAVLDRPPEAAVLIAWAARSGRVPARLAAAQARAEREGRATAVALGPLDRAAAASCSARASPRARPTPSTGAAPATPSTSRSSRARTRTSRPPWRWRWAAELATVAPAARTVLEAAAVAGGEPFEPDLVAEIAEREEGEVLAALDELVAGGLVRATGVPRRFAFRRPLVAPRRLRGRRRRVADRRPRARRRRPDRPPRRAVGPCPPRRALLRRGDPGEAQPNYQSSGSAIVLYTEGLDATMDKLRSFGLEFNGTNEWPPLLDLHRSGWELVSVGGSGGTYDGDYPIVIFSGKRIKKRCSAKSPRREMGIPEV